MHMIVRRVGGMGVEKTWLEERTGGAAWKNSWSYVSLMVEEPHLGGALRQDRSAFRQCRIWGPRSGILRRFPTLVWNKGAVRS